MCKNVYVFPNNSKAILLNFPFESCAEFCSLMPKPYFACNLYRTARIIRNGQKVEIGRTLVDGAAAERERVQFIYEMLF